MARADVSVLSGLGGRDVVTLQNVDDADGAEADHVCDAGPGPWVLPLACFAARMHHAGLLVLHTRFASRKKPSWV